MNTASEHRGRNEVPAPQSGRNLIDLAYHPSNLDPTARIVIDDRRTGDFVCSVKGGFIAIFGGHGECFEGLFDTAEDARAALAGRPAHSLADIAAANRGNCGCRGRIPMACKSVVLRMRPNAVLVRNSSGACLVRDGVEDLVSRYSSYSWQRSPSNAWRSARFYLHQQNMVKRDEEKRATL